MDSLKSKYANLVGDRFFLENDIQTIEKYLKSKHWLGTALQIQSVEKPGEGNMNLVLRLTLSNDKSFIIKQARPWVEKYPELEATTERIGVEHRFYQEQSNYDVISAYSPRILGYDDENCVLLLEDLGESSDFSFVYQKDKRFEKHHLDAAINYLHHLSLIKPSRDYPSNLALRKLNHQHIFQLPFVENKGFNLDDVQPGLQALSQPCTSDEILVQKVTALGEIYLGKGSHLLHGDFYPGSILNTDAGLRVIDPEFSFVGPLEWDLSIFVAHLYLSQTDLNTIHDTIAQFRSMPHFDNEQFTGFVGTEIIRRLIGLAQLPLNLSLDEKEALINNSIHWIKSGIISLT